MKNMRQILVRKGEFDISVRECWEYEDGSPAVLKRHWFLAPGGLETESFPEMLQRLLIPPPHPLLPPTDGVCDTAAVAELPGKEESARNNCTSPEGSDGIGVQAPVESNHNIGGYEAESSAATAETADPGTNLSENLPVPKQAPLPRLESPKHGWTQEEDSGVADDDPDDEEVTEIQKLRKLSDEELEADIQQLTAELRKIAVEVGVTEEEFEKLNTGDPSGLVKAMEQAVAQAEQEVGEVPRCQHVKADGKTCGCFALRRKRFCHFHSQTAASRSKKKTKQRFQIPVLEDASALQVAVTNICRGLANESLEPKRASMLLYGLQVATAVLRKEPPKKKAN